MKAVLVFTVLVFCFSASAEIISSLGHTHGNAGDPLRMLFREARVMAADRVKSLKVCEFKNSNDQAKVQYIISVKEKLAEDILKSKHVWLSDFQGSCAFTQFDKSQSPVYLSYPECRSIAGNHEDAIELLIHESLHHVGVEIEEEADLLSQMIVEADTLEDCPTQAYDEFDPKSCDGDFMSKKDALQLFGPGRNTTGVLGKVEAASRFRRCNSLTGCADWAKRRKIVEWYNAGKKLIGSTLSESDFDKDFSLSIKTSSPTVLNVNIGLPNFNCALFYSQQKKARFGCKPNMKKRVSSTLYNYFLRDAHTKRAMYMQSSSTTSKHTSFFRKSCFWLKNKTIGEAAANGDYLESEMVLYSKF